MAKRTALIIGATGLVGKELLELVLPKPYYEHVKVVVRKPIEKTHSKLEVIVLKDFSELATIEDKLEANDYFCTLGTTIKKAGSKKEFKKIDLEYPLKLAEVANSSPEFRNFLVVTAAGSNANSPLFYNQVKGELEERLKAMNLAGLKIFRPSLLLGDRKEFRLGEELAKLVSGFFSFFMVGMKRKLWSIQASDVAKAMYIVATETKSGVHTYDSSEMITLAKTQEN